MGYVIGIGAANVDMCGRSHQLIVPEDSNPGSFTMSIGGVTRNICENAARMGADAKLITVLGDDIFAEMIRRQCDGCGVGIADTIILSGDASSVYMSLHEPSGEMSVAMSDMSILQQLTPEHLQERQAVISGASAIVMDGGLPEDVLHCVLEQWGSRIPIIIDPVSTTYAHKFVGGLVGCHTIKPNALEAEVLTGIRVASTEDAARAARGIIEMGAERAVITMGARGAYYLERRGEGRFYLSPRPDEAIANATGAGDCLTGGLVYGLLCGWETDKTMRFAMNAATITITSPRTIHPLLREELIKRKLY